ncbi:hypothetical protein D3C84_977840 [compost metagenome]
MQKAVVPHRRQQLLEIEAFVFDSRGAPLRRTQKAFDLLFILGEEHSDDFLLVGEVVVQVAGRNLHVRGNVVGADTTLALLVEQLQAVLHDALAGLDTRGHDQFQALSLNE